MAAKSPTGNHNYWGTFSGIAQLPNVSGATKQSANLEVGDTAYSIAEANTYTCTAATPGAAVWVSGGGVGGSGGAEITLTSAVGGASTQGEAVYINGDGTFGKASTADLAHAGAIGFVNEASVADAAPGQIITGGPVTIPAGLQLGGAWLFDDVIYLSATGGSLTKTVPTAPGFETIVGRCTNTPGGGDATLAIQIELPLELTSATVQQTIKDIVLSEETSATSFVNIGSVYLPAGTLESTSLAFLGTVSATDTAELELRRETGATLIATWDVVTSVPVSDALGSSPSIPANDWYSLRLRTVNGIDTARVQGVRLIVTS
jgi:hypothetical protein